MTEELRKAEKLRRSLFVQFFITPMLRLPGRMEKVKQEKLRNRTRVDAFSVSLASEKENEIIQELSLPPEIAKLLYPKAYQGEISSEHQVECLLVGYQAGGPGLERSASGQGFTNRVFPGWARLITGPTGEKIQGLKIAAHRPQGNRVLFRDSHLVRVDAHIYRLNFVDFAEVMITSHQIIPPDARVKKPEKIIWHYQTTLLFEKHGLDLLTPFKKPLSKELANAGLKEFNIPVIEAIELAYHFPKGGEPTTEELRGLSPVDRALNLGFYYLPHDSREESAEAEREAAALPPDSTPPVEGGK